MAVHYWFHTCTVFFNYCHVTMLSILMVSSICIGWHVLGVSGFLVKLVWLDPMGVFKKSCIFMITTVVSYYYYYCLLLYLLLMYRITHIQNGCTDYELLLCRSLQTSSKFKLIVNPALLIKTDAVAVYLLSCILRYGATKIYQKSMQIHGVGTR